jgi:hypothetical protein
MNQGRAGSIACLNLLLSAYLSRAGSVFLMALYLSAIQELALTNGFINLIIEIETLLKI